MAQASFTGTDQEGFLEEGLERILGVSFFPVPTPAYVQGHQCGRRDLAIESEWPTALDPERCSYSHLVRRRSE